MLSTIVLAASLMSSSVYASSEVIWLQPKLSALVKLDTAGYPLWVMDRHNPSAPALFRDEDESYWQTEDPSAVLLNLTMSPDNHTLFINGHAILPLTDSNRPPRISAHQVHADTSIKTLRTYATSGMLRGELGQEELQHRNFLELDYDRLVEADPETGPYFAHKPTLRFRIMGLGAFGKDDVLDVKTQQVLHVTLNDTFGGISKDKRRSYAIVHIEFKDVADSYHGLHLGPEEDVERACTLKSWACPDTGLYTLMAPYYRFIWRHRFDQYGRIGSFRHTVAKAIYETIGVKGMAMLKQYGVLTLAGLLALLSYKTFERMSTGNNEKRARAERALKKSAGGTGYSDDEGDDWIAEHSKSGTTHLTDKEVQQLNYIIPEE